MSLRWTRRATADLVRLHEFLAAVAPEAAARVVQNPAHAPDRLIGFPRLGEKLDAYAPREVRRIFVGAYEIRYEVAQGDLYVLRLWHAREHRPSEDGEPPA